MSARQKLCEREIVFQLLIPTLAINSRFRTTPHYLQFSRKGDIQHQMKINLRFTWYFFSFIRAWRIREQCCSRWALNDQSWEDYYKVSSFKLLSHTAQIANLTWIFHTNFYFHLSHIARSRKKPKLVDKFATTSRVYTRGRINFSPNRSSSWTSTFSFDTFFLCQQFLSDPTVDTIREGGARPRKLSRLFRYISL